MTTKDHPTYRKFRLAAFLCIWHILGLTVLQSKVMVVPSGEWVFEHKRVFLTLCWTLQTNPGRGGACEWTRHLYSVLSLSPGLLGWLSTQLWLRCSWCLVASMQHTEGRLFLVNSSQLVRTALVSEGGGTSSTSGGKTRAGTAYRSSSAFVSFIWWFLQRLAAESLGMKYYLPNCLNLLSRSFLKCSLSSSVTSFGCIEVLAQDKRWSVCVPLHLGNKQWETLCPQSTWKLIIAHTKETIS